MAPPDANDDRGEKDPYDLDRFGQAQESCYGEALAELKRGDKQTHWMWFIFPQLAGLGISLTAQRYAIKSLDEAKAYLAHAILGPRLIECADAVLAVHGRSAEEILGPTDAMKLRSCATLFAQVSPPGSVFEKLLDKYYQGQPDDETLRLLRCAPEAE